MKLAPVSFLSFFFLLPFAASHNDGWFAPTEDNLCPDGVSYTEPSYECDGYDDCGDMSEEQVSGDFFNRERGSKPHYAILVSVSGMAPFL